VVEGLEESLVRPIYYKVSERPSSYNTPLKGSWFSERKYHLISHLGITITTLDIISLQPSSSLTNLYLKSLEDLKLD
jgi:hypothetical protein